MKKLLTLVAAASCMAVQTYGQGTVLFIGANITNSITGQLAVPGTTFKVALYWLPYQPTAPPVDAFMDSVAWTTNLTLAGGVNGGVVRIDGISPAGHTNWFQVRAWENLVQGDTWREAVTRVNAAAGRPALAGTSNVALIDTADPTSVPPGTPPNTAATLKGFVLVPVPEPSVIGLGVLGLASLFFLRRRS